MREVFSVRDRGSMVAKRFQELLLDDRGQDLVEYALLTGLIAAGSVLLFAQIAAAMNNAYAGPGGWNEAAQEAWEPCAPNLGACP